MTPRTSLRFHRQSGQRFFIAGFGMGESPGAGGRPFLLIPFCLLMLLLLPRCSGDRAGDAGKAPAAPAAGAFTAPPVPVNVQEVRLQDVKVILSAVGTLEARDTVRVPARVAGVVQDIAFQEGKWVKPEEVLARIDPERYQLAARRAEATYRQAEAAQREAEAALDKRKALRQKDAGWVTEEELSNFTARLDQAQASVAEAKAAFDLASKDLHDSEVRADAAGLVNQRLVDTGQYLTAGTPVAIMIDSRKLKLVFKVAESEAGRLSVSSKITFKLKAAPDKEFTATLYHVGETADPSTRMVDCLAWVDNPGRDLRPGFFADVSVEVAERKGSLVVPQTAVLPTDRGFVGFVLKGENRVERRSLRLGLYTKEGNVEVLDGLRAGDKVIVRGAGILDDDSVVAPTAGGGGS
jgi:membrane fusion protein, multidrug efflux system